jgi:hypothetical protein
VVKGSGADEKKEGRKQKKGKWERMGRQKDVDSERGKWNRRQENRKKGRKESFKTSNKERRVKDDKEWKAKK